MTYKNIGFIALLSLPLLGFGCTPSKTTTTTNSTNQTAATLKATDSTTTVDSTTVVTTDVYGQDLDFAPRSDGSIRSYYSANLYETDITYQTTTDVETIRKFYTDTLTAAGWVNSAQATDYMEYSNGSQDNPEILTVYFTDFPQQNVLEYELVYEPALTADQLK